MTFTVLRNSCTLYTFTVLRQKALLLPYPHPMPGDHAPPRGGPWAPFWAFGYVITDLRIYPPPSPSHASDPVTRIYESSYRRVRGAPVDPLGLGCVRVLSV